MDQFGYNFFYLADTLWYGLTRRCTEAEFEQIIIDRKEKGFTAVQLVVGTPPEISIWDKNAKSTHGEFIFNRDFQINPQYFSDISRKVEIVVKNGLIPVLFGSWGNYIDETGVEPMKELWSQTVKHFGTYPVIYCLTGEVDIFPLSPALQKSLIKRIVYRTPVLRRIARLLKQAQNTQRMDLRLTQWQQVAEHLVSLNQGKHPLTVHIHAPKLASDVFTDSSWIVIDSFQSGHGLDGFSKMAEHFAKLQKKKKPFVNLESLYEGILGQYDLIYQNYAFWKSVFSGAIGHVYGAHGLWQMAKKDNFMPHWGSSNWKKALQYPGSLAVGKAKELITKYDWKHIKKADSSLMITYQSKPVLSHLTGEVENTKFVYIPYSQLIESLKTDRPIKEIQLYETGTYTLKRKLESLNELMNVLQNYEEILLIMKD